ncbi:hypothetical protein FOZ62_006214 [Perkinsus olseni]|uniref:Peptidase C1A papain C-terminal domain-containing protein n=1 Tax=Perkinsus olseni TaxID=32597 RepID=A0A7J6QH61_PEROL|nr:hypothetical protein FOZ62_006214 [Perkinsus olseni]
MQHNAEDHTFKLEVNEYTDMTDDEWANHMLVRGGLELPAESPLEAELDEPDFELPPPGTLDWVRAGVMSPLEDRGQCGSCWAFSATGALEARYHLLKNQRIDLSEQELIDCGFLTGTNGCNGGLIEDAFVFIEIFGIAQESEYPYTAKDGAWSSN